MQILKRIYKKQQDRRMEMHENRAKVFKKASEGKVKVLDQSYKKSRYSDAFTHSSHVPHNEDMTDIFVEFYSKHQHKPNKARDGKIMKNTLTMTLGLKGQQNSQDFP